MLRSLTILLATVASCAYGLQCHKVIIAGDSQWPPYTVVTDNIIKGVGVDLAKKIFAELDVPVEEVTYSDLAHMMQGLRDGEIDLVVSTYDYSGIRYNAQLLEPAYVVDPVTVAVPVAIKEKITSWDSLVGMNGISEFNFVPDDKTAEYLNSYLHVSHKDNLLAALQSVQNGHHNYMVGSDLQLTYEINAYNMQNLIVMKNLAKDGDVHMAFSKTSPCKQYTVYVQKRLQDYKNNGTVEKILKKYAY